MKERTSMKTSKMRSAAICTISALILSVASPVPVGYTVYVHAAEQASMSVKEAKAIVNDFMGYSVDFNDTEGLLRLMDDMNLLIMMEQNESVVKTYITVLDALEVLIG